MTRNEQTAQRFNESVDYFTCCYGNPFEDCAMNLLANYADMKSVNESWANGTITKTIKRMPKSIILNVLSYTNTAENRNKFDVWVMNAVFSNLINEAHNRGIYF